MDKLPEYRRTKSRPGFPDMPCWQKGYTFLGSVASSHPNLIYEVDLFGNHVRMHSLEFLVLVEAKTDDASGTMLDPIMKTLIEVRLTEGYIATFRVTAPKSVAESVFRFTKATEAIDFVIGAEVRKAKLAVSFENNYTAKKALERLDKSLT